MLRIAFTAIISSVLTAASLVAFNVVHLSSDAVGAAQAPTGSVPIVRNTMLETAAFLDGGTYSLTVAEIALEPGAATGLHSHPGPSVGFVQAGRLSITVPDSGRTSTSAAGSALDHPWDHPHIMSNNSDERAKMLSFELLRIAE